MNFFAGSGRRLTLAVPSTHGSRSRLKLDTAGTRPGEPGKGVNQRALTRSVAAEHGPDLSGFKTNVEATAQYPAWHREAHVNAREGVVARH